MLLQQKDLVIPFFHRIFANNTQHNNIMKRLLFSILALCSAAVAMADEPQKAGFSSIEVRTRSGETTIITLTEEMTTTFNDTAVIFADAINSVQFPLAQFRSYTFVPAVIPEGITTPVVSAGAEFYTVDGRRIDTLAGAPTGTYVVRNGKTTFKVLHNQ